MNERLKLLDIDEVCEILGISRTELFRLRKLRNFPHPVRLGVSGRLPRWSSIEINRFAVSMLENRAHPRALSADARSA